ncbi:hypothetical protein OVA24_16545 [Luteolibacter sp. SL250]|uniref:hypothetical protein n=1 Tax=Luteolibacter sp. SL250 TaxID=2995170 RepID=UPI00226F33EA|nr:hypothetical protein [Luteolibacter sp. SL250]WAC18841.1 hypothetical protein OVA24_16545 [Luteolibacter sp. SL250]
MMKKCLPTVGPLFLVSLLTAVSHAEVRLLTGGSDNVPHKINSDALEISADGDRVIFSSGVASSGPSPGLTEGGLYLRTLSADTLEFVSGPDSSGVMLASMSEDGRYLAWSRDVPGTGAGNGQHIFWRDRVTGTTRRISAGATENCHNPVMSADGRYVAFITHDRNLPVDGAKLPAVGRMAVYLYDSQATGSGLSVISLRADGSALTTGVGANSASQYEYDFSKDGRYVVFSTDSAGVHPDTPAGSFFTVYRRSLVDGSVVLLSRNASSGVVASGSFVTPRISADGGRVAFAGSFVAFLGPTKLLDAVPAHLGAEVYVKDVAGPVWRATTPETGGAGGAAQDGLLGGRIAIDGDGDVVSYACSAKNLVLENTEAPATENSSFDVFRADLPAGGGAAVVSLISKSPTLAGNVDYTSGPLLPGSGAYVAFNTAQVNQMLGAGSATFGNNHGFGVGTLPEVVPPAGETYAQWSAGLPVGDRDYADEPAGDGIDNLLKYFVGMAPLVTDHTLLPVKGMLRGTDLGMPGDTAEYLTLDVRVRRELPAGFTWKVACAPDLAALPGSTTLAVQVGSPVPDGDHDVYRFRHSTPVSGAARGFMRLVVEGP